MVGWASTYRAGLAAGALMMIAPVAISQIAEADGGARIEAGLDLRLELDNGDPEFRTGFDIDLISATRTQRLSFSGDFGVVVPLDDPDAAEFRDPNYGLDYVRDTGRSRLSFGAGFSRRDLDGRIRTNADDPFDEDDLTLVDGGTEERRQLQAALELGLTDAVGAEIRYSFDERLYSPDADPRLEDRRRDEVGVTLRFDVSQTLRLGASAQWSLTEEDTGLADRDERLSLGVDAAWQLRPDIEVTAALAYSRIETEDGPVFVDRDGIDVRLGLGIDRPNGDYSFGASRVLNATGFVTSVDASRRFELPRGVELTTTLGATQVPSGNTYGTGALALSRETRSGALSLSLSQTATINNDDEEVRRRILQGNYRLDLPREAALTLGLSMTESVFIDGADPDLTSARVSLGYDYPLSEQWNLGGGVDWQVTREEGGPEDEDYRLFLTLQRRFILR